MTYERPRCTRLDDQSLFLEWPYADQPREIPAHVADQSGFTLDHETGQVIITEPRNQRAGSVVRAFQSALSQRRTS